MSLKRLRDRLRLPSRLALLLGFGAASAAGAQAATTEINTGGTPERVPQQSGKAFGELAVWTDDGRVFVSESGKPAQELRIGNTAETAYLRGLLERHGASAISPSMVPDRIILVGGGGSGIGWVPADRNRPATPPAGAPARGSGQTAPGAAPGGFGPPGTGVPARALPPKSPQMPGKANTPYTHENG